MTNRELLTYALKAQRLHEVLVLKDDIHLQYKYKNINRARNQAATFQDKIIDAVIEDAVTGTSDPIRKSTVNKMVENIIDTNLRNDTRRISYGIPERAVEAAVSNSSNRYQFILGKRIREEIPNLQSKIDDYINSKNLSKLSEAELTNKLKAEYGDHAQKRIQNIIKDSFHTNECNLSWIKAIYDGYSYKIWNNGRTKRTRVWHKAKFIKSVPIDETFDIFGSYPARMMYPGDLNGGAENVANCKCWLSYSNRPPSDLRKQRTYKVHVKSAFDPNKIKNNFLSRLNKKKVVNIMKDFHDYGEEFKNGTKKARKILNNLYKIPKNLIPSEINFLVTWGEDSGPLNNYLRGNDKVPFDLMRYFANYIKNLNNAINKYSNIKYNTSLHRRVNEDFYIADVGKEGIFTTPISTTFNKNAINNYGEFHITVLAPAGSDGAYIEEIMKRENSENHNHDEWLLPINTKYKTLYKDYGSKEAVIMLL